MSFVSFVMSAPSSTCGIELRLESILLFSTKLSMLGLWLVVLDVRLFVSRGSKPKPPSIVVPPMLEALKDASRW